jgi:hypothetical protein
MPPARPGSHAHRAASVRPICPRGSRRWEPSGLIAAGHVAGIIEEGRRQVGETVVPRLRAAQHDACWNTRQEQRAFPVDAAVVEAVLRSVAFSSDFILSDFALENELDCHPRLVATVGDPSGVRAAHALQRIARRNLVEQRQRLPGRLPHPRRPFLNRCRGAPRAAAASNLVRTVAIEVGSHVALVLRDVGPALSRLPCRPDRRLRREATARPHPGQLETLRAPSKHPRWACASSKDLGRSRADRAASCHHLH